MNFENYAGHVADNIRKARWASGLTQEQVAEHGVSYKHYQEIEGGRRVPSLATLYRLAHAFGTTVAELTTSPDLTPPADRPALADLDVSPPKRGRKKKGRK